MFGKIPTQNAMDFNVRQYEKLTEMISNFTLVNNVKKPPLV